MEEEQLPELGAVSALNNRTPGRCGGSPAVRQSGGVTRLQAPQRALSSCPLRREDHTVGGEGNNIWQVQVAFFDFRKKESKINPTLLGPTSDLRHEVPRTRYSISI